LGPTVVEFLFAGVDQYSVFCNLRPLKEGYAIQNYLASINFFANWFFLKIDYYKDSGADHVEWSWWE
jgi:hypothetical protein